jgi:hypothetical protein
MLDDRHAAAETAVSLRQLEPDIAAPEHDQMCREVIEFERFDVGERPGRLETGNVRNCRTRSDVEEHPITGEDARAAVVEPHLQRLRRHEAPAPHDQFGPGRFIRLQMKVDFALDHVALSLANSRHVGRDRAGHHAKLGAPCRARCPTLALQISFLVGRQATLGQDPPIH